MEFPDDFTELGRSIADADEILINKRATTFSRIKTWILGLVGTSAGTLAAGDDARLSDARTPTDASVTTAKLDATLSAKVAQIQKLGTGGSYIANIQTVSTSTATISADVDLVIVTYSGGTCALTFGDSSGFPTGRACIVQKANTSANGITIVADGSTVINGGLAGLSMTLPDSTTASSSTTRDPAWLVQRTGTTAIRVS